MVAGTFVASTVRTAFIIGNYFIGSFLYYIHASMRGCDSIISDEPYAGTAKSAEKYVAGVPFKQAKQEGCKIEVNWQDQDFSSKKSFHAVFHKQASTHVIKCGGHVEQAHANALKDIEIQKEIHITISKHRKHSFKVDKVTCCCKGKNH